MSKINEIAIVQYPQAHSASMWGLTDLLLYANQQALNQGEDTIKVTHWRDAHGEMVKAWESQAESDDKIDFIIIPPSFEAPLSKQTARNYSHWIRQHYQNGTVLCSICSGVFTLLETNLFDGRTITTHWLNNEIVRERFPNVNIDSNKIIVEDPDVITTAGIMSWMDLGLKLIERIYTSQLMVEFSKLLLVDPPSREQSYYKQFLPNLSHGDIAIVKIQHWLQNNYANKVTVDDLAELANLEKRTLLRRFKKATGLTPIEYCQNLRIHKAQDLLLTTNLSFDSISWQVGYKDCSSFNKIFVKTIGLTSTEYRKRFKS